MHQRTSPLYALDSVWIARLIPFKALDTGTSLIYLSPSYASSFYSLIPGAKPIPTEQYGESGKLSMFFYALCLLNNFVGFYSFPCNSSLDVALSFGGTRFSLNVHDFNLGT